MVLADCIAHSTADARIDAQICFYPDPDESVGHSKSHVGWAKAPEDWAHSRTLARGRRCAGAGNMVKLRAAIQPMVNRSYLAGAGGFRKFALHSVLEPDCGGTAETCLESPAEKHHRHSQARHEAGRFWSRNRGH